MLQVNLRNIVTPIGVLSALAEEGSLRSLLHHEANASILQSLRHTGIEFDSHNESINSAILTQTESQLAEYFAGTRTKFKLKNHMQGTLFQKRIWKAMLTVPFGETISYSELASRAGHPQAIRAAGSACGANSLPIIIPCHRITRTDGSIGSFALGVAAKQKLLALEEATSPARLFETV